MEQDLTSPLPLGVLLIATFWILLGVWILLLFSSSLISSNPFTFIALFISIFFIFLGWGVLSLKKWAGLTALILSILGIIPSIYAGVGLIYLIISGYWYMGFSYVSFLIMVLFCIPMTWYLAKNLHIFHNK